MNLLARAKMSSHLIFSSPSPVKRLFNHLSLTALQQYDFYSTKTTTRSSRKTQELTKPKIQKSSGPSSTTFCQRVRKQTEALTTVWPKPGEIPYQAKIANFVNLIGHVELPVRFESASDGRHFATTVISLVNGGGGNSLMIPIVFEGDLAHVVSCHVKENNCVFVSGQLSVDPMRLVLIESLGKFHVMAENFSFVEGFKSNVDKTGRYGAKVFEEIPERVDDKITGIVHPSVKVDRTSKYGANMFVKMPERAFDDDDDNAKSAPSVATMEREKYELKVGKGGKKNGESVVKKNDADLIMNLWRDLVKNPLQWWDYRNHKANGLVKEKHPDFKQKVTGESLWIRSAPKWVLPGIGKLEFDIKQANDGPGSDSWKDLVENPDSWWDNRTKKTNPKAPDFKHKKTGEPLWLGRSPGWVSSKLPPVRN
ncbi:hypothetical protein OROGR_017595 [Orobanche gracilis]